MVSSAGSLFPFEKDSACWNSEISYESSGIEDSAIFKTVEMASSISSLLILLILKDPFF